MKAHRSRLWLLLKIAILSIGFFQGFFPSGVPDPESSRASASILLILALGSCLGVFSISALLIAPKQKVFAKPSWLLPPFTIANPLFVFDFCAYYMVIAGVGVIVGSHIQDRSSWLAGMLIAIGIGLFIGVKGVLTAFKERFTQDV
jgi:hypothetical protein